MAVDAAFLIRVGSAILSLLLGIAVLIVGRRRKGPLVLGAFLVSFGGQVVLTNVRTSLAASGTVSSWLYPASVPFAVGTCVFGILVAFWLPKPGQVKLPALVGLLVAAAGSLAMFNYSAAGDPNNRGVTAGWLDVRIVFAGIFAACLLGILGVASVRLAQARPTDRHEWARWMAFIVLLAPATLFAWPNRFGDTTSAGTLGSVLVMVTALSVPPLGVASRTGRAAGARWALLWPALGVIAYAYLLVPGNDVAHNYDIYGINGVLRIAGWAFLVYAILRHDLLGVELPHFALKRGTLAAGALATLFIVAQVAQNFFSAQYGLLTGGIVAGAFLFVASPVQRAMERVGERSPVGPRTQRGPEAKAGKQQEAAFRDAVRLAWRDRRFDQAEEVTLANLADSMGLTAKRATEIRHEVEREKGVR